MDIIDVYLKSLLTGNDLSIFMKLPQGMKSFRAIREKLIIYLLQSIYGLRQSGRLWNQKVVAFFTDLSFIALNANPSILIQHDKDDITMVNMYIDNFFFVLK